jgi:hypothetical protein
MTSPWPCSPTTKLQQGKEGKKSKTTNKSGGKKKGKKKSEGQEKSSLATVIENCPPKPSLRKKGRNNQKQVWKNERERASPGSGSSPRPGQAGTVTLSNQTGGTLP